MSSDECVLLLLLLNGELFRLALHATGEEFAEEMYAYYREPDIHARILTLLPAEFQGAQVLEVQRIGAILRSPMRAEGIQKNL